MPSNVVAVIVARCRNERGETWFGRDLAGKPQIAWSIDTVRALRGVSQVVVWTDEPALAEHARRACVSACWWDLRGAPSFAELAPRLKVELADSSFDAALIVDASYPLLDEQQLARLLSRLRHDEAASIRVARRLRGAVVPSAAASGSPLESCLEVLDAARALRLVDGLPTTSGANLIDAADELSCLSVRTSLELRLAEVILRERAEREHRQILPSNLEAVIFDFDGVLTDNAVWVEQTGRETVRCDRGDGMGVGLLQAKGLKLLILSKERNPVVSARAEKLKLECLQGIDDKLDALKAWLQRNSVARERALYVGNDVNDLECMRYVGTSACPRDAHERARQAAQLWLSHDGGHGAVRELCDRILERLASAADFG